QERTYNDIAQHLASGKYSSARDVVLALKPVYPEDREFQAAFAEKELRTSNSRNNKVVRYILFALERHLSSGQEFEFESARYSVEHILPEHPKDGWDHFDEAEQDRCVYQLGNITLLKNSVNRDLGNAAFTEKRPAYEQSEFAYSRKIAEDYDEWTVEKVQAQQNWMSRQAISIWKISQ
ncbi:MAG: HNH endonuclease family protein, partial [Mariprofundales bacterium]|nr:HNH endonuclease family protein [Mariprofundales bacterium]